VTISELLRGLPPLLAAHLELALAALAAAIAISLPLSIAIAPRPRLALPVVTVAGVIQTIPGLALLALMVPVLVATYGLGVGFKPFGFSPAVIALTLYAILPIVRNSITGLRGVDASAVEAARGMGMTRGQILRQVELPLAAPVIAAGIRTASVWTVGAATLATPVGQPCLGNYIFAGLQTRNWSMLLVGVIASAALAVALDLLLGAAEHTLASRKRKRVWLPIGGLLALIAVVILVLPRTCAGTLSPLSPLHAAKGDKGESVPSRGTLKIGAKTFTEQYILAEVLRARLAAAGIESEVAGSLGSTVIFDALTSGDIDAYVDYSGTLWTNLMHREPGAPRWQIVAEIEAWLAREHRVRALGTLGFENAYAIAVRRDTAEKLGLHTLADLATHGREIALGADYEFFGRAEWASVRDAYGLTFKRQASFDPTLLYDAITRGEVDAIAAFSSDGRIAAHDLVVLADPAGALPPYDAMLLLGPRIANDPDVACALAPLTGALPVELVRQANLMVDRDADKQTPAAASAWLLSHAQLRETCVHTP
jgi:osmoprotectant transport system permease protein